jgi:hypothetical protein
MEQSEAPRSLWEEDTSRRGFLRRLGKTLAVGLGVAMIPIASAQAAGAHCCRSTCASCPQGNTAYTCFDECANKNCCICFSNTNPNCFDKPCGACQ